MLRSFMPLDFFDLLVAGKGLSNKARTREGLGRRDARVGELATLLGEWFNPRSRPCAWVYTEGLALRGLASVRDRSSARSWEVNRLLVGDQDSRGCLRLLEHVSTVAGQQQVSTIFLRLPAESPLLKAAQDTGLIAYTIEHLYWRQKGDSRAGGDPPSSSAPPRRRRNEDEYRLFELYLRCVPAQIRRAEGMTYKEWQANRHRIIGQEWVFEKNGGMVGWVATSMGHGNGLLDIVCATKEDIREIADYSLTILNDSAQVFSLVPDSDPTQMQLLEERGFSRIMTYSVLVKEFMVRVVEPYAMPAVPA